MGINMRRRLPLGVLCSVAAVVATARAQDADQLKPVDPGKPPATAPADTGAARIGSATEAGASTAPVVSGSARDPFRLEELTVTGQLPRSAASSDIIRAQDFELRPMRNPSDLLRLIPGLWTAQHQGGGKADQIFLRGFDADHGTDVAVFEEGVPMNLRTHAHGQGFADQHGVIPEMVDSVEVRKGTYFADLGDFATAGSMRYTWRDQLPGDQTIDFKTEGGSFDTSREYLAISPYKTDSTHTIVAGEAYYTNGPTDAPQDYLRLNLFAKGTEYVTKDLELSAWTTIMKTSWSGSGQIPLLAVQEGLIGNFGAIDSTEGGRSSRINTQAQLRWTPTASDLFQTRIWACQEYLRLNTDFHFFELSDGTGLLPEGIQQDDQRWMAGGDTRWEHTQKVLGADTKLTVGLETRNDLIDLQLRHQIHREVLSDIVNVHVVESSAAEYAELEVKPINGIRVIGGVRGDEFNYTVTDQGGAEQQIQGNKNDSLPQGKGSIILGPFKSTDPEASTELYFDVGSGYHSNDARVVVENPHGVTLPQVITYEVGARTHAWDRLDVGVDFFLIDVQSELTFDGDDGTVSPNGPTRRLGVELEFRYRISDEWLWAEEDFTYCEGRFTRTNLPIPEAPRLFERTGLMLKTPIGIQAFLNANFLGRRPLDDAGLVDSPNQFTADLAIKWIPTFDGWKDHFELFCRIENVFNAKWREAQFYDHFQLQGMPAPVSGITYTPGAPRSVYGGVEIKW
jgi:hypothetical protein